jgi:hypothetical protein
MDNAAIELTLRVTMRGEDGGDRDDVLRSDPAA